MSGKGELLYGRLPHMLLSVASLTPRTLAELMELVEARYGFQDSLETSRRNAGNLLNKRGMLAPAGQASGRGTPMLYTLTPAGEAELDRLWDIEHGRSAA